MAVIYIDADKCPLCESKRIRFKSNTNEFYCKKCGYVLQDSVYHIERRYNKQAEKIYVNPKKKKIAVIINSMLQTNLEKKMKPFQRELKRLKLTSSMERDVLYLCRKAIERKLTLGKKRETLLAALIYASAKRNDIPITISELEKKLNVDRKKILRTYKKICRDLEINQTPQNFDTLILKIASKLNLPAKASTLAIKIAKDYRNKIRNPKSLAAVSIYLACGIFRIPITKREISKAGEICTITLQRNWKKMEKNFNPLKYKRITENLR